MIKTIQNKLKNRKGFTLVELIIVIAVLGILAAIAVPKYAGMKEKARQAVDSEAIVTMNKAIELYNVEHEDYPDTKAEVEEAIETSFDDVPTPEEDDKAFFYHKTKHEIVSLQEDTEEGTTYIKLD